MSKSNLSEAQLISNNAERESLLATLEPFSQGFIKAARTSNNYKKELTTLNSLPKDLPVKIIVSLSGRNFNKLISSIDETLRENTQRLFKEFTGHIIYIVEHVELPDPPLFKKIELNNTILSEIPSLQNELSIFHMITVYTNEKNTNPKMISSSTITKKYEIYGNLSIKAAHDYLLNRRNEIEKEEINKIEVEKGETPTEHEVQPVPVEPTPANLPFDKHMEFINLPNTKIDLTGPFLLKWSQQA